MYVLKLSQWLRYQRGWHANPLWKPHTVVKVLVVDKDGGHDGNDEASFFLRRGGTVVVT